MKKAFWRPFLIFAIAALFIIVFGNIIPAWDNEVFPLKKIDIVQKFVSSFQPSPVDSLKQRVERMEIDNELEPLRSFLDSLNMLRKNNGNVRIAYYGDSIIEGDLISGKLRDRLQEKYGGSGVGLVGITSIVSDFRWTVRHRFSRNWETLSFDKRGSKKHPLGMIGYTYIPRNYYYAKTVVEREETVLPDSLYADSTKVEVPTPKTTEINQRIWVDGPAWVEYSAMDSPGGSADFRRIRLFYGQASLSSSVRVSINGGKFIDHNLQSGKGIQVLDLSPAEPALKIRLEFDASNPLHVYGVSFDDTTGVYVDNLAVRGYTGMYFNAIPQENLRGFQEQLGYDLLILQYGMNVSRPHLRDFSGYEDAMGRSIEHIRSALPEVPILLLSVHDRSVKIEGKLQTSPDIPILVETQSRLADSTGCAFWNIFESMGGVNSMLAYAEADPRLANLDYTHFTLEGANKIAEYLYKVITTGKTD
jgi:lysophospholipase L1-like esterase